MYWIHSITQVSALISLFVLSSPIVGLESSAQEENYMYSGTGRDIFLLLLALPVSPSTFFGLCS